MAILRFNGKSKIALEKEAAKKADAKPIDKLIVKTTAKPKPKGVAKKPVEVKSKKPSENKPRTKKVTKKVRKT